MKKTLLMSAVLLASSICLAGCNKASETAATNANANAESQVATVTRPGPDNSDITTATDANGVKTETRTFHNNPRVSKLVVTTRNGVRTTRVYSRTGEEKEISDSNSKNVLEESGDAIAGAAGFVADKTVEGAKKGVEVGKTAAEKTTDTAKTVGEKTAEGAKTVGEKTAEGAKTAGHKTAEGAKTVGEKTAEGAKTVGQKTTTGVKKAGRAIKRAITP